MNMDFRTLPDAPVYQLDNVTVPGCLVGEAASLVTRSIGIAYGKLAEPGNIALRVNMGGAMAFPAFIDMHTHLDKGHIWPRSPNPDGTFDGALQTVRADRPGRWDMADLRPRMEFSLKCAYAHGTRAIRTHLDHFEANAWDAWEIFADLRETWAGKISLQASMLTGSDLADDPARLKNAADGVARYQGVIGTVTYPNANIVDQIRAFFAAAADRGTPIDFHVDETMDPGVNTLRDIATAALDIGFSSNIVVGHLCSLSTMPEVEALDTLDLVAKAGLHVVSLPMCNLYLQDRHHGRTPLRRGITLVHEMKKRGIPVSFASDNTRDPFYAYGDMDMLEVMKEATRIGHLDHSDADWTHAFLTRPAEACGFDLPSLNPGAPADLVLTRAREWTELFARPQADRIVLRAGATIDRTLPDYAELDHLMVTPTLTRTA